MSDSRFAVINASILVLLAMAAGAGLLLYVISSQAHECEVTLKYPSHAEVHYVPCRVWS